MRRRQFITLLGGTAVAWPLAARAQEAERVRRIGALIAAAADDPEFQARVAAFLQGLSAVGLDRRPQRAVDTRWATTNPDDIRRHAAELAAFAPDVILAATGTATVAPLLQATRTVPIVFVVVIDPVGAGFVAGGSQRRQPARLAWLERVGADPKPHLVLLAPRQLPEPVARCSDRGAA